MTISEIKHENVRCCLLPWRPWSVGLLASRWINCVIHFGLCSFGLCVPKLYFHLNLKWHCLHLKGISDHLKPLNLISNFFKPKIAFFAFKICAGEYILCSFGLCVPKLYFQLNQKWHCLHLKCILDPVKPLYLISNFFKPKIAFFAFKICIGEYILCSFGLCVPKFYLLLNLKWHCLHLTHLTGIVDTLKPLNPI